MKSVFLLVLLAASAGLAAAAGETNAGQCGNADPCGEGVGYCKDKIDDAGTTTNYCERNCVGDASGASICDVMASCWPSWNAAVVDNCECPMGYIDTSTGAAGTICSSNSRAVRYVLKEDPTTDYSRSTLDKVKDDDLCDDEAKGFFYRKVNWAKNNGDAAADPDPDTWIEMRCLYKTDTNIDQTFLDTFATVVVKVANATRNGDLYAGPTFQTFVAPSTSAPLQIPPTGLTVNNVFFNTTCAESGCWTITGIMATGGSLDTDEIRNNVFNTFFLPFAEGDDELSYDYDYTAGGNKYGTDNVAVEWTFQPRNHPCTSASFGASGGITQKVSTCCITNNGVGQGSGGDQPGGFLANYRVTTKFATWAGTLAECKGTANAQIIQRIGYLNDTNHPHEYEVFFPADPLSFLGGSYTNGDTGTFTGMPKSPGVTMFEVVDPFMRTFNFRIELDEVELRQKAGKLVGTVGVEHTVDTFLGVANFRTTGLKSLDTFATQAAIHLEKTSFFTVSTHGVNDYTFLEYVNMRLVAIYNEDNDFSSTDDSDTNNDETTLKMIRTDSDLAGHYVQVTFTVGSKFEVNDLGGSQLIPTDSVRVGKGTFMGDSTMEHKCVHWTKGSSAADPMGATTSGNGVISCEAGNQCGEDQGTGNLTGNALQDDTTPTNSNANKKYFEYLLAQSCAPQSTMCSTPSEIPDQFVSYNIPLGIDYLPAATADLSQNIFVSLVVNAIDTDAQAAAGNTPNAGDDPRQIKTTLTASIPVVDGGVNIFCDGVTGKTDLTDVAQVDLILGSANSTEELTRLRILEDIQSSSLSAQKDPAQADSDSIEAGLMTLVIKGNESYFQSNPGRQDVKVELEDVITIHIMESNGANFADVDTACGGNPSDATCKVYNMITTPADDNTDASTGLQVDGYDLNGAFKFVVDRGEQQARLEPKDDLLAICPFNPPRPSGGSPLTTCVTRRDIRNRGFPFRNGALSTAIEICPLNSGGVAECHVRQSPEKEQTRFFVSILGDSEYAKDLSVAYAETIKTAYDLNGRYRRAFWINPGYEWTPTQTGGRSLFSISQKIFMFAIVTMDEGLGGDRLTPPTSKYSRRRMLLQSTPTAEEALKEGQSGIGTQMIGFQTTPTSMMAKAFEVPEDRVVTFDVKLQLTQAEACSSDDQLLTMLQATLEDYVKGASSPLHTVQITRMEVDKAGVQCTRRAVRGLKASFSAATADVTVLAVFKEGQESKLSVDKLRTMAGVQSVDGIENISPKVNSAADPDDKDIGQDDEKSDGSSSNTALIAGVAGGVGAALVLVVGAVLFMKSKKQAEPVMAVQTINVQDLKSQLAGEV